jgi:hypothetical protein
VVDEAPRPSESGPVEMEALKRRGSELLRDGFDKAQPQSLAETQELIHLLHLRQVRASIDTGDALAAVTRRQITGSFSINEAVGLLFERWEQEPRVVAFFRDALRERGPAAIADLAGRVNVPWDGSLLEPIIGLIERMSRERGPRRWDNRGTIWRGLEYLERNHTAWQDDRTVAPRLSAAVLRFESAPDPDGMYRWATMVALTRDRAMIPIWRRYLTDSTIDNFTSMSSNMPSGVTPLRYSELAANAICRLLDEPVMFNSWRRATAPRGRPYPEWLQWDMQIAELQRRLTLLGY